MKWTTAMRGVAITGLIGSLTLTGCGSSSKSSEKSTSSSGSSTSTSVAASKSASPKVAPRKSKKAVGPHPTIASYVEQNGIAESTVHRGDPGSPTIDLPIPDAWRTAGDDTPDWAYGAIIYTGPEAAEYSPSIVALVSKLTGDVDPQKIIDLAPGELNNLPGYQPMNAGATSTLGDYPAYQLGGTWVDNGQTKLIAQKTVVIPASDGLYVLQLNADGLQSQGDIISAATDIIDSQTTIST